MRKLLIAALLALIGFAAQATNMPDFKQIQYWAGQGPDSAALCIQFPPVCGVQATTLVVGYRFTSGSSDATGEAMIRAVASMNGLNKFVFLIQYTGGMGYTLDGIGYAPTVQNFVDNLTYQADSVNANMNSTTNRRVMFSYSEEQMAALVIKMGQTWCPTKDGAQYLVDTAISEGLDNAGTTHNALIDHPLNYATFHYPCYDYDYWTINQNEPGEPMNFWISGWYYDYYWSYWVGSKFYPEDGLSYSGLGMSSTQLVNGAVNLWMACPLSTWHDPGDLIDVDGYDYVLKDYTTPIQTNSADEKKRTSASPSINHPFIKLFENN